MASATACRQIFLRCDDQIVMELERFDATAMTASDLKTRQLWVPGQVDHHLAQENIAQAKLLWTLPDHLNTVRDVVEYVSGSTSVANHITYDSFGDIAAQSDSGIVLVSYYTGRFQDFATGNRYHRERWTRPSLRIWLSEDPISFQAGDVNLYRYVGNGAIGWLDPMGFDDAPLTRRTSVSLTSHQNINYRYRKYKYFGPPLSTARGVLFSTDIRRVGHVEATLQGNYYEAPDGSYRFNNVYLDLTGSSMADVFWTWGKDTGGKVEGHLGTVFTFTDDEGVCHSCVEADVIAYAYLGHNFRVAVRPGLSASVPSPWGSIGGSITGQVDFTYTSLAGQYAKATYNFRLCTDGTKSARMLEITRTTAVGFSWPDLGPGARIYYHQVNLYDWTYS